MNNRQSPFGFITLVCLVIGNAIGAGVYTTSGYALADLGARHWVMLAWIVGGMIALCGAASYAMLARQITQSGGEYLYLSRSLHPLAGAIAGWLSLIAGFSGAIAFAASAFETYMRASGPGFTALPQNSVAIGAILFAGCIHFFRVHIGTAAHNWIVTGMMVGILGLCAYAGFGFFSGDWQVAPASGFDAPFQLDSFAVSLVWISLSYSGFNAAVYVAGEVKNPRRDLPRAMMIGTFVIMLAYIALNAVFLYVPSPHLIAGRADVAALAAEALQGPALRRVTEAIIAVSLLTSVTAMVLAGPHVYAKMADDSVLPRLFRMKSGMPPRTAILLQVALAILITLAADLRDLLSYLGFSLSVSLALAVSTLFIRHARTGIKPSTVLYPLAPALFVAATLTFGVLSALREPMQFFATILTIAIGATAYYYARYQARGAGKST